MKTRVVSRGDLSPRIGRIFTHGEAYADFDAWHAAAAQLRREDPVHRVEVEGFRPFWAITRHADVLEIERDPERFHNTDNVVLVPEAVGTPPLRAVVQMDGEEHRAFRGLTSAWFRRSRVKSLQSDLDDLASALVDQLAAGEGPIDVVEHVAFPFPLRVIMHMLGLPVADHERMRRLTQAVLAVGNPGVVRADDEDVFTGLAEFYQYFEEVVQDRLQHPTDDLSTVLAQATIDGQPLGPLERFSYLVVLIIAGHDTTASALSGGIEALLRHPDQLHRLQGDPDAVNRAVEEIVRWVSPVKHFMRYATEDYTLRGRPIKAGEAVLLSFPSANRDEAVFQHPERFDVDRDDVDNHLGFGFGAHFCLGAHLARMELQAFFRQFVDRLVDGEILDGVRETHSTLVSGFSQLSARCTFRADRSTG